MGRFEETHDIENFFKNFEIFLDRMRKEMYMAAIGDFWEGVSRHILWRRFLLDWKACGLTYSEKERLTRLWRVFYLERWAALRSRPGYF